MLRNAAYATILVAMMAVVTAAALVGIGAAFALASRAAQVEAPYLEGWDACDLVEPSACP